MSLRGYSKVYQLGHRSIRELLDDSVVVEEKYDGSQLSFGINDQLGLLMRSHHKAIDIDAPDKLFAKAVEVVKSLEPLMEPGWTYRGEYFQKPKHNTLAYERIPAQHIMLFDVDCGIEDYLSPAEKALVAAKLGLEKAAIIYDGRITDREVFQGMLKQQSSLGGPQIEGVVIKNYAKMDLNGHAMMGKYVSEAFKEVHRHDWKKRNPAGKDIKETIGEGLATPARYMKAVQRLRERGALTETPSDIGPLMKEASKDILEECKEDIQTQLWKWAWGDISKRAVRGLPQWYKDELVKRQFGEDGDWDRRDI